jgi:hypothetical protein
MTIQKVISAGELLKKAIELIRKDNILVMPSLIASFVFSLLGSNYLAAQAPVEKGAQLPPELLMLYGVGWLITILAQAVTIYLVNNLLSKNDPDISEAFGSAFKRFPYLILILFLVMLFFISTGSMLHQLFKNASIYLAFPLIILVVLVFQLLPVIILLEDLKLRQYFSKFILLVKSNFANLIRFFLLIIFISFLVVFIVAAFDSVGEIGKKIFIPFTQGISSAITTIVSVIFYLKARSKVV